jgi:glycosyltransferase involved in cell wall biosynthesis
MAEIFPKYGIDFEVLYMAKIEPNRQWIIPGDSYLYKYKIFKGIHPTIGNFFAHFNPGLLLRLLKNDYDLAVVGGMASPTHWLAPLFIGKKKVQIMSIESNLQSVKRKKGVGAWIKNKLLAMTDAYQVTGSPQIEYIKHFYPDSTSKTFVTLPNLIDDDVFVSSVDELRKDREGLRQSFGVNPEEKMWLIPARLIDIKGVIPFIKLLDDVRDVKLFVVGEGELLDEILNLCNEAKIQLTMPGFVQQDQMVKYYAAADLFVLPSLEDPSPLSPIEACAAGLPLLVSSRIGNLEDVVNFGENGWSYDPLNNSSVGRELIGNISRLTSGQLAEIGGKSRDLFFENFHPVIQIERYAESLLEVVRCYHND